MTNVAIVEVNSNTKPMKNSAIASATNRYPTRLASSVHFAIVARRARTGSIAGAGDGSGVDIQSGHATSPFSDSEPAMSVRVETVDIDGAVMLATLDRPDRRNAVDHQTLLDLAAIQAELMADSTHLVRVLVLTGAPPAFSAGADLNGVEEGQFAADLAKVLRGFGSLSIPVIAAIDGPALGAGAQLAVAADLRVATPDSVIGVPAAKLGLVVDHWTVRRLADELSPPVARAMLLGAETYTASQLHTIGGIHRLGGLDDALAWAERLSVLAPLTIAGHKIALEHRDPAPPIVAEVEAARVAAWASADAAEGRTAFLEKRPAHFTGA